MTERIVIVVEGGVVQNIMTDNPRSEVVCYLVDYDNLKGGQTNPPGEWTPELNPSEVELCATGQHPDMKKYLVANIWAELGNIPINDDGEIQEEFQHFSVGTNREEIWHWIEETYKVSVHDLMIKEHDVDPYLQTK